MGEWTPDNIDTTNEGYGSQFEHELLGGMVFIDIYEADVLHLDKIKKVFVGDLEFPLWIVGEFQRFDQSTSSPVHPSLQIEKYAMRQSTVSWHMGLSGHLHTSVMPSGFEMTPSAFAYYQREPKIRTCSIVVLNRRVTWS